MKPIPNRLIAFQVIVLILSGGCVKNGPATKSESEYSHDQSPGVVIQTPEAPDKTVHTSIADKNHLPERFLVDSNNSLALNASEERDDYFQESTILSRDEQARMQNIEGQVNEIGQVILAGSVQPYGIPGFQKYHLSEDIYLSVTFDNDIFSNTDYYYTSGLNIELFHPSLRILPTARLLPAAGKGSVNHFSISLTQTLYTPIDPDKADVQHGDRPFASFLVLGHSRVSNNPVRKLRLTSRINIGVIGPAALGGTVQKTLHDIEPVGWQNQITNDLLLNYFIKAEKGIRLGSHAELIGMVSAEAGTLKTNLSAGGGVRLSNAKGYFESVFLESSLKKNTTRVNYFFMIGISGTLVGYDATLQGGWIESNNNVYVIAPSGVSRGVFHAHAGTGINIGRFGFEAEHFFLSPEFSSGKSHMYTRLKTSFKL